MAGSEKSAPRFDPALLQARWVLAGLSGEELTDQAVAALEQGYAGIALQQLAGLTKPNLCDLGTLPERAFGDLGLKPIDREQAVNVLIARGEPLTSGVILSVLTTLPAFLERWRRHIEWWRGEPAGVYNDMAEVVHFVVEDLYDKGDIDGVRDTFQLLERKLIGADQETIDLIGFGFIETLQNFASWRPYGSVVFEQFLGPTSRQIWNEIQRIWVGKSSLADVIRAERHSD